MAKVYSLKSTSSFENNTNYLPESIRGLLIGNSNCGKTNILFKLLLEDWVDYDHLYIFSKSLYQPAYQLLIYGLKQKLQPYVIELLFLSNNECPEDLQCNPKKMVDKLVKEMESAHPDGSWKCGIQVYAYSDPNLIPEPEHINPKHKNLFIFDDCYLEDRKCQTRIQNFYSRGRHSNLQCFYISQDYHHLDRQTIRVNSNFLILFKLPKKDLSHIYDDIVSFDEDCLKPNCDYPAFLEFSKRVWDTKYEFMIIDKFNESYDRRYRKGFDINYSVVMENYIPIKKWKQKKNKNNINEQAENSTDRDKPSFQGTIENTLVG